MNKNDLYYLRPDVFVNKSLAFMQGYPKWKVVLYMPIAYLKVVYYTLTGK